ncbi:MAG: hypothetical protein TR69_WS6001000616 [candidate division WS6 bacterium OLB20]|uniref:Uncharacterized protein n=1 Tax=candidate division WS6 bacterium OLB20 TaxID=1617426 RepID=A0A136LY67_9BACT|nr:MAG: hypothetical protein TR69_WS6001000616 [candidate division WS6 bacterium OLB20]
MIDFFLDFVEFNATEPQYDIIIPVIIIYLLTLWFIISVWVFFDARKRMNSTVLALVTAIANLILQFPFLFMYLLIRPSSYEDFDDWIDGGVNVPIVNFTGKDGVVMSFELRVNPKRLAAQSDSEMKIDVSFESDDEQKTVVPRVTLESQSDKAAKQEKRSFLSTIVSSVNGRIRAVASSAKSGIDSMSSAADQRRKSREAEKARKDAERKRREEQEAEERREREAESAKKTCTGRS